MSVDESEGSPADGQQLLRELTARWRGANTLEYRSEAIVAMVDHPRLEVRTHVRLRRPNKARLVFVGNRRESTRARVSDGLWIYDRMRSARDTIRAPFRGQVTENISHPLDIAGYSVDQFFSTTPFLPPAIWGDPRRPVVITAVHASLAPGSSKERRLVYRVMIARGRVKDTLWLDRYTLAPVRLNRFGLHDGLFQEMLNETFTDVRLGPALPSSLFVWTKDDEAGAGR